MDYSTSQWAANMALARATSTPSICRRRLMTGSRARPSSSNASRLPGTETILGATHARIARDASSMVVSVLFPVPEVPPYSSSMPRRRRSRMVFPAAGTILASWSIISMPPIVTLPITHNSGANVLVMAQALSHRISRYWNVTNAGRCTVTIAMETRA